MSIRRSLRNGSMVGYLNYGLNGSVVYTNSHCIKIEGGVRVRSGTDNYGHLYTSR